MSDETTGTEVQSKKDYAKAIKELIAEGKDKGFVTLDEICAYLELKDPTNEQLERIFSILSEIDIEVLDSNKNVQLNKKQKEKELESE